MSQLKINEVCPKGEVYPLVVNSQNGFVTDNFKKIECVLLENENTGKKASVTELLYTGEEEEEPLGKTLILARNKKTGEVRLIEGENIEVKQLIKSNLDATEVLETSNLDATEVLETSNLELSRKFGSKKHK